jgi:Tfp pilus assembly protein PilX
MKLRRTQSGVILLFTLVALVVVLIAGLSLIRAMDVSLLQAGNLAFRRDLANQAERGIAQAVARFSGTGALSAESVRNANVVTVNYSASRLATNAQGIPTLLLNDAAFTAAGMTGTDLTDTGSGVTVRIVVDRQCAAAGDIAGNACALATTLGDRAADDRYRNVRGEAQPVYRISVRATGPRNTQAFFQSTVAR